MPAPAAIPITRDQPHRIGARFGFRPSEARLLEPPGMINSTYALDTKRVLRVPRDHSAHVEQTRHAASRQPDKRGNPMRQLFAALSLILAAPAVASAAAPIVSGDYDGAMIVAYNPANGEFSGYVDMSEDGTPSFSCVFYLQGKLTGASAAIETYYPGTPKDVIKGKLILSDPKHFRVVLVTDPGGCQNLQPFNDASVPATFDLADARPWTSIAVVKSNRAYFYDAAGAATHRKAYVVQDDGLGVRAAKHGWVQVEYTGGNSTISGWLKASDLYTLH
jgi:hypothetical protein